MRDIKKYQALMESTIRGEILAADPTMQRDPFEVGKEFREKVGSGGFARPGAKGSDEGADTAGEDGPATNEDGDLLEPDPNDLIAKPSQPAEAVVDEPDELPEDTADDVSEEGEGERGEA
jgi:hypothetical protein